MKNQEGEYWFTLHPGDAMVNWLGHYRFRRGPAPGRGNHRRFRHRDRSYRMLGYLRARADREAGRYVRIGSMGEFRGIQDENYRRTERNWKSHGKRKHQWE